MGQDVRKAMKEIAFQCASEGENALELFKEFEDGQKIAEELWG